MDRFLAINEEFFMDSNLTTLKNSAANKILKVIVCFVFNAITYIISKECGKEDQYLNELAHQTQDSQSLCE